MKKSTNWMLIIAGLGVLLFCGAVAASVGYLVKTQMDEAKVKAARLEAELERSNEITSVMDDELEADIDQLKSDIDQLVAMQAAIEKKEALVTTREMTPEQFSQLSDLEVLEILAYDLLPTEYVDIEAELEKPMGERGITETLTAPKGHFLAGDFQKKPGDRNTSVLFDDVRFNADIVLSLIADKQAPLACDASQDPEIDEIAAFALCSMQKLDKLARLRLGTPLYKGVAMFDPKAISAITEGLLALPPEAVMYEGERTLAQVYRQLDGAIPAYLETRAAIARHGDTKALKAYREALDKRGMFYTTNTPDMMAFYEDFAREQDIPHSPYIIGFWMRRMDDGSATIIHDALLEAQKRYGTPQGSSGALDAPPRPAQPQQDEPE